MAEWLERATDNQWSRVRIPMRARVLARDQSARTGEIVWFYNGRDRKKTDKIVRNGHFGQAVSESWLNP